MISFHYQITEQKLQQLIKAKYLQVTGADLDAF
jgi:hypothetical protein